MISRSKTCMALLVSGFSLWAATADAHFHIQTYTGGFTSSQVECDTLCTGGPLTGGLAGTLSWHMSTMESTCDPDVVKLTGVDTITTATGSFSAPDITLWNLATGDFVDIGVIGSGTGSFAGSHGTLTIQGFFDPALGHGTSTYFAVVTFP